MRETHRAVKQAPREEKEGWDNEKHRQPQEDGSGVMKRLSERAQRGLKDKEDERRGGRTNIWRAACRIQRDQKTWYSQAIYARGDGPIKILGRDQTKKHRAVGVTSQGNRRRIKVNVRLHLDRKRGRKTGGTVGGSV